MATDSRRSVTYSQNFLKSRKLARRLVGQAGIDPGDTVIEIGPGTGVLTRSLARQCHQVIAVEKDAELAGELNARLADFRNVVVFAADFLDLPLPLTPYKVFANIPFNVTTDIVHKLTRSANPPDEMHLVIQHEAAGRFLGTPRTTMVSVLLHPWFDLSVEHRFRNVDFVPPPRVDVVLLRFSKRGPPLVPTAESQAFRDFVVYGFTAWKPTVGDAYEEIFSAGEFERLAQCLGMRPDVRPSDAGADQWLRLYTHFRDHSNPHSRALVDGADERLRKQQVSLVKSHRTRSGKG